MRILIAVDDSSESVDAVHYTYATFGAGHQLIVASVGANPVTVPLSPFGVQPDVVLLGELRERSESEAEATALSASENLPVGTEIEAAVGSPGPALVEIAIRDAVDLIVIGSHERSIWERLFHPSVGRHLIDHAPCPVLVVRGEHGS